MKSTAISNDHAQWLIVSCLFVFGFLFVTLQIIDSPMSFFDTTPSGQILNRFSKDQEDVDVEIPFHMAVFFQYSLLILYTIMNIVAVFPTLMVAVVIMGVLFILLLLYVWFLFRFNWHISLVANLSNSQVVAFHGNGYMF